MPSKSNTKDFIRKATNLHGDKYDYSKVKYFNNYTKVSIICPTHGKFLQTPNDHLDNHGCRLCAGNNFSSSTKEFIIKARKIHGDLYSYKKVKYKTDRFPVSIICKKHGVFKQTPHEHLRGHGCQRCGGSAKSNLENFIFVSKQIHGNYYDYSQFIYTNNKTKGIIVCPKHGNFCQIPNSHLNGKGCPKCCLSGGELAIRKILERKGISYKYQMSFDNCKNPLTGRKLKYDFYIPSKNLLIEYDGPQHFMPGNFKGFTCSHKDLKYVIFKDKVKNKFADDNKIKLLRIKFTEKREIQSILDCFLHK